MTPVRLKLLSRSQVKHSTTEPLHSLSAAAAAAVVIGAQGLNDAHLYRPLVICFDSLHLSQQLWSCRDGQFTLTTLFLGKLGQAVTQ